ncbi:kinesin-like protein KIN-14F [Nymphaea colorata]|nr:kinesin-like protein KIN-14F [Nymphaea colorata]XP_049933059.1 kinesin-like protein KIN-14F [Nymphaea colorata]XP_049933060.1 kinesin-like protein KIN-14F [Nymphaea colorata]XP_049933061.1 kinesin-like protein KIN-14F [Nymphaea colorata]XP_049933062.1 kinesin-like protein KIN-14F [Nymphaea colorata]
MKGVGTKAKVQGLFPDDGNAPSRPFGDGLAYRKAEETAYRRYQAAQWLRKMDQGASESLSSNPSEEEFCLALRNGLILCNVLKQANPGAVSKVVENPVPSIRSADGAAHSAIQYFENMRNFLVAVKEMKLLAFEVSDLEKGGMSSKVVDCILCLKGYHEWRQDGGIGIWRYGGTVKSPITVNGSTAFSTCYDGSSIPEPLHSINLSSRQHINKNIMEVIHKSCNFFLESSEAGKILNHLFDQFGLGILQTVLTHLKWADEPPLHSMIVDAVLEKVVQEFNNLLLEGSNQLELACKEILGKKASSVANFLVAMSIYFEQKKSNASNDNLRSRLCCTQEENKLSDHGSNIYQHQLEILEALKRMVHEAKNQVRYMQSKWQDEFKSLEHRVQGLVLAASSYNKALEENRQLYNQVQDLKGTIRVYCRARPFLSGKHYGQSIVDYIGENGEIMIVNPDKPGKDARKMFSFNKVFGGNATQEQVYADVQPLIRSVLDGYNVCIFAYGQTGSGKTFTMSGPEFTAEKMGLNYRALSDLFHLSKSRENLVSYTIGIQMVEIYNEKARDLLVADGTNRKLDIRNNSQRCGFNVPEASLVPVNSAQDAFNLMIIGQRNRAVGATALNERSSRSHSVLILHVQGSELSCGSTLRGRLYLVDLAGSERVDKSEAVGERLKEAQHINKSLSALADVISALGQKNAHIPYRNSKLTQLLQESLGGQAKTLMFVHINPHATAYKETISTLKFAERVSCVELGAARSNKESSQVRELKEEISNLMSTLRNKETELEQLKGGKIDQSARRIEKTEIDFSTTCLQVPKNYINRRSQIGQPPPDETGSLENKTMLWTSCTSPTREWNSFPSAHSDRKLNQNLPSAKGESGANSKSSKLESPPQRRSLSVDYSKHRKSRMKGDVSDNQDEKPLQYPSGACLNRSISFTEKYAPEGCIPLGNHKQDKLSTTISQDSGTNLQKFCPDHEKEQFRQVLNVTRGAIRKKKAQVKIGQKFQVAPHLQRSAIEQSGIQNDSRVEQNRKSGSSEPENRQGFSKTLLSNAPRPRKLFQSMHESRIS